MPVAPHTQHEYCTLEWVWDQAAIRINLPDGTETLANGSYADVVGHLTALGHEGWLVAACVANTNWVFWTLQRPLLRTSFEN